MTNISDFVLPLLVLGIISYGLYKKVDIYDVFISGVEDSFILIKDLFPCLLAMILGINIFINSGIVPFLFGFLKPVLEYLSLPFEILPMAFIRPISGGSSLAILSNILKKYGPDSFVGRLASVLQGSTDTTLYVITLYFGSINIKKIRYALIAGLCADVAGIITSFIITSILF
jgi:spore maturation protein B